jgi:hypothetical protein
MILEAGPACNGSRPAVVVPDSVLALSYYLARFLDTSGPRRRKQAAASRNDKTNNLERRR